MVINDDDDDGDDDDCGDDDKTGRLSQRLQFHITAGRAGCR